MLDLPEHILRHIVSKLDKASWINLACTCRYLQPFAEEQIWLVINPKKYPITADPYRQEKPMSANDYLIGILAAMERMPERRKYVKIVAAAPTRHDVEAFTQLLGLVASSLEDLVVQLSPAHREEAPSHPCRALEATCTRLKTDNILFPHLSYLGMPFDDLWRGLATSLLERSPNLHRLHLSPGKPDSTPLIYSSPLRLPTLEAIAVDKLQPELIPFLLAMIDANPGIRSASIGALGRGIRGSDGYSALIDTLRGHKGLTDLSVHDIGDLHCDRGGFEALKTLGIMVEGDVPVDIPLLHNLEVLKIDCDRNSPLLITTSFQSMFDQARLPPNKSSSPLPVLPLTNDFVARIKVASSLTEIKMTCWNPDPDASFPIEPENVFHKMIRTDEVAHISSFQPPNHKQPPIIWVRVVSHVYRDKDRVKVHTRDRVTQDYVDYGGRMLSSEDLHRLCSIAGLALDREKEAQRRVLSEDEWRDLCL